MGGTWLLCLSTRSRILSKLSSKLVADIWSKRSALFMSPSLFDKPPVSEEIGRQLMLMTHFSQAEQSSEASSLTWPNQPDFFFAFDGSLLENRTITCPKVAVGGFWLEVKHCFMSESILWSINESISGHSAATG